MNFLVLTCQFILVLTFVNDIIGGVDVCQLQHFFTRQHQHFSHVNTILKTPENRVTNVVLTFVNGSISESPGLRCLVGSSSIVLGD